MHRQRSRRSSSGPEVYRITGTATSHTDDLNARMSKYVISMSVRVACVVLAFVVDGWLRWAFVTGAVVLPYVAVVFANAGRERPDDAPASVLLAEQRTALPPSRVDLSSDLPPDARRR